MKAEIPIPDSTNHKRSSHGPYESLSLTVPIAFIGRAPAVAAVNAEKNALYWEERHEACDCGYRSRQSEERY